MENSKDQSKRTHSAGAEDYNKYLVHSKTEIVYILRAVIQKRGLVTAYFNQGKDFILTSFLDVDANRIILDYGAKEAHNRKILDSQKIVVVTTQDRVKVQFSVPRIEIIRYEGGNAFRIPLPESVLKLQRREFFRIETPITTPLQCTIPLDDGREIPIMVTDVSIGGVGIIGCPPDFDLAPGMMLPGCRIALPGIGEVVATLEIRSTFDVTLKNGAITKRAGCCFIDLPSPMQVLLQRYIIKLERGRRAKLDDQ